MMLRSFNKNRLEKTINDSINHTFQSTFLLHLLGEILNFINCKCTKQKQLFLLWILKKYTAKRLCCKLSAKASYERKKKHVQTFCGKSINKSNWRLMLKYLYEIRQILAWKYILHNTNFLCYVIIEEEVRKYCLLVVEIIKKISCISQWNLYRISTKWMLLNVESSIDYNVA